MKTPIFVRPLSEKERESLEKGLRSKDAFAMRRSQVLLASAKGERAPKIASNLGCASQTVRDAIHDFNRRGLLALEAKSSRPRRTRDAFDEESAEKLRGMLHAWRFPHSTPGARRATLCASSSGRSQKMIPSRRP